MHPFIKWVGGKQKLIPEILKRKPGKFKTYFEPFVGGGALLFKLKPKKAIINDINKELMIAYSVIKNDPRLLREFLLLMETGHNSCDFSKKNKTFYNAIREIDRNTEDNKSRHLLTLNDSNDLRAARLIFLNKNNFNGIYRVNSNGYFNVPSKNQKYIKTFDWNNLKEIHTYLKKSVEIRNTDFEKALKGIKKNDFVYFDPPYDYEKNINGFDSFQKNGFGTEGQKRLANLCKKLDKKGVKFLVSNHNTKLIQDIYSNFKIDIIKVKRLIGGKGAKRKFVEEVLIYNY